MMQRTHVVIAGAGPVGLALAYGLARQGIRSVVLEKLGDLSPESRAPGILPRTMEILRNWGLLERFMAAGTFLKEVSLWYTEAGRDELMARLDLSEFSHLTAVAGILLLPQYETERLLLAALAETGLSEVYFSHQLSGFVQDAEGVTIEAMQESGGPVRWRADYLVGCDGAHSAVRMGLGWELEGKTYPTRILLADVRLDEEQDKRPWPRFHAQGQHMAVGLRLSPGFWRLIGFYGQGLAEGSEEDVAEHVQQLFDSKDFTEVWASMFRIHCRVSPGFRSGRILLAGDAAHINSPAGGQGMNSGIQDAHDLAWKLARAIRGGDASALLIAYEEERRHAIVQGVERFTDLLTRLVVLAPPRSRRLTGRVLRLALRSRWFMRQVLPHFGMFSTHYPHSPLLVGDDARVGRRAADGVLVDADGQEKRLLDLVGPHASLLLFSDQARLWWQDKALLQGVSHIPDLRIWRLLPRGCQAKASHELSDSTGEIWRAWHPGARFAALLRPDGFVGWVATAPTAYAMRIACERALGLIQGPSIAPNHRVGARRKSSSSSSSASRMSRRGTAIAP